MGKMILDISQIPMSNLTRAVSPHKPLPEPHCGSSEIKHMESVLVLNHFKGSSERYSFRNDSRRTFDQWKSEEEKYRKGDSSHFKIDTWLQQFLTIVGSERQAAHLLRGTDEEKVAPVRNAAIS